MMTGISQNIIPEQRVRDRISRRGMGEITNRSNAAPTGCQRTTIITETRALNAATVTCFGAGHRRPIVRGARPQKYTIALSWKGNGCMWFVHGAIPLPSKCAGLDSDLKRSASEVSRVDSAIGRPLPLLNVALWKA